MIGNWKLTDYTFNGNSIITQLNSLSQNNDKVDNVTFHFSQTRTKQWDFEIGTGRMIIFNENKALINDTYVLLSSTGINDPLAVMWFISPFKFSTHPIDSYWYITKLYKNDLHIKLGTDSGEYKIYLNKINK
ncbi:MAG TPA: hypothetical protein PLU73_00285 [Bacteroidia bacterium]|nr:hypothetical protein [Bacteroidia bacterium]